MIKIACSCGASTLHLRRSSVLKNSLYSLLSNIQHGQTPGFRFHNQPKNLQAQVQVKPDNKELVGKNNEELISLVKFPTRDEIEKLTNKKMPVTNIVMKWIPQNFLKTRMRKIKIHEAIEYLYEDLCDEVVEDQFFLEFMMPDTFASWFTVIELHVYIMSCRFMKHEEEEWGLLMRDILLEQFWLDVEARSEKLGGKNRIPLSQRKKDLFTLDHQLQAAFYGYDEGIQSNDKVLAAMVWRRIFAFECYDAVLIERLVKYIRVQLYYLTELTTDEILYKDRQLFIPLSEVTVP